MRILLDTNVFVSGLISAKGPPGRLLDAWLIDHAYDLLISTGQLEELARVMCYDRIARVVDAERIDQILGNLDAATIVGLVVEVDASPDPADNVILGAAIGGGADLVVSGDKRDMLEIGSVQGIEIINAAEAWKRVESHYWMSD